MRIVTTALIGLLFGIGLIMSGMINPAKVQNFLDVFGTWDPSLAFVMIGAIAVTLPGYHVLQGKQKPKYARKFHWPKRTDIDARLIVGAALFGVGWGLGGLCPGPALTGLSNGGISIIAFVVAMLAGITTAKLWVNRSN